MRLTKRQGWIVDAFHRLAQSRRLDGESVLDAAQRLIVTRVLETSCWIRSAAAARLGLNTSAFHRRFHKYDSVRRHDDSLAAEMERGSKNKNKSADRRRTPSKGGMGSNAYPSAGRSPALAVTHAKTGFGCGGASGGVMILLTSPMPGLLTGFTTTSRVKNEVFETVCLPDLRIRRRIFAEDNPSA